MFYRKCCLYISLIVLLASHARAMLSVGAGTTSFTSGRFVPSIEAALWFPDQSIVFTATGARNSYYYQSSYLVSYFRTWRAGDFLGGDMDAGFGGSIGYSSRGFQDESSTTSETVSDVLAGPAIYMSWSYGFLFFNFSAVFGLRDLGKHISGLTAQDVESIALGVRY